MTDATMLERAARAAYDHSASFEDDAWVEPPDFLDLKRFVVDGHVNLIEIARAVLMAVREPDDSMIEAWSNAEEANDHPEEYHLNRRRYAAMIDAILADGEGR